MTIDVSYEDQRIQNIKDNEALLLSLGLHAPSTKPASRKLKPHKVRKPTSPKKRKRASPPVRPSRDSTRDVQNNATEGEDEPGPRRSRRNVSRVSYVDSSIEEVSRAVSSRNKSLSARDVKAEATESESDSDSDNEGYTSARQRNAARLGVRTQNPKTFGHIPGVKVGTWWRSRMDASTAAIHAPTVAGISGNAEDGAWSVALSGGYPDDVDLGEAFTYTGSGGRDLKGTKQNPKNLRSAPQTSHQSFDNPLNAALKRSAETRQPVRVIRGFKLDSAYAPPEGYRYDGLYVVERAWMAKGLTKGLLVCRYAFKRLPGQPPLPTRSAEEPGSE